VTAGTPEAARIVLPARAHLYDLRTGKYLGQVSQADTRLRWGRANFYLALPYAIKGVNARLSEASPAPGTTLRVRLDLNIPASATEKHAVWVEVTDPTGERPLWGRRTVILTGHTSVIDLPVALNAPRGKWRIRATELFSGQTDEAVWTVRP